MAPSYQLQQQQRGLSSFQQRRLQAPRPSRLSRLPPSQRHFDLGAALLTNLLLLLGLLCLILLPAALFVTKGNPLAGASTVRPSSGFFTRPRKQGLTMSGTESSVAGSGAGVPFAKPRSLVRKLRSVEQAEGVGARVRRSIGRPEVKQLDPFLMLDYLTLAPPAGFPDHPHRGFETVTYVLEGAITHEDFAGHKGTIKAGDLQWMTAGKGIVHSEMPASNGVQRALQLWVNLPAKDKMIEPAYQELESKDVREVEKDGVKVRVIAGESLGVKSQVYTRTATMFLDFTLHPGAMVHQPIPADWNAFSYTLEGQTTFGSSSDVTTVDAHYTVLFSMGDGLVVSNQSDKPSRFLLIAGQPLDEPIVQYGPFVMNTQRQIREAIEDYHNHRNGFERARTWVSDAVRG